MLIYGTMSRNINKIMDNKKIKKIAEKHLKKIGELKQKQEKLVEEFFQVADEAKAEEIKKNLSS